MSTDTYIHMLEVKVVILGQSAVGKTCMLNQFVRGHFIGNSTTTIGAAFMKKTITINNWHVVLSIWDTAGQERFRSMAPMYYRGAHAAVLVFDVTSSESLDKVQGWVEELQQHANEDITMVVAANKSDLRVPGTTCVPQAQAESYGKSINASVFETSAKTGKGIEDLFQHVASTLLKNHLAKLQKEAAASRPLPAGGKENNVKVGEGGSNNSNSGCCT